MSPRILQGLLSVIGTRNSVAERLYLLHDLNQSSGISLSNEDGSSLRCTLDRLSSLPLEALLTDEQFPCSNHK